VRVCVCACVRVQAKEMRSASVKKLRDDLAAHLHVVDHSSLDETIAHIIPALRDMVRIAKQTRRRHTLIRHDPAKFRRRCAQRDSGIRRRAQMLKGSMPYRLRAHGLRQRLDRLVAEDARAAAVAAAADAARAAAAGPPQGDVMDAGHTEGYHELVYQSMFSLSEHVSLPPLTPEQMEELRTRAAVDDAFFDDEQTNVVQALLETSDATWAEMKPNTLLVYYIPKELRPEKVTFRRGARVVRQRVAKPQEWGLFYFSYAERLPGRGKWKVLGHNLETQRNDQSYEEELRLNGTFELSACGDDEARFLRESGRHRSTWPGASVERLLPAGLVPGLLLYVSPIALRQGVNIANVARHTEGHVEPKVRLSLTVDDVMVDLQCPTGMDDEEFRQRVQDFFHV